MKLDRAYIIVVLPFSIKAAKYALIDYLKALATRTHCCGHIVANTNVSRFARSRNICNIRTFVHKK